MLAELASRTPRPPGRGCWVYERKLDGLRCLAVRNGTGGRAVVLRPAVVQRPLPRHRRRGVPLSSPADRLVLDAGSWSPSTATRRASRSCNAPGARPRPSCTSSTSSTTAGASPGLSRSSSARRCAWPPRGSAPDSPVHVGRAHTQRGSGRAPFPRPASRAGRGPDRQNEPTAGISPGRSPDWQKLKCTASQELVIGGWTEPQWFAGRASVPCWSATTTTSGPALCLLGKVGTGFDHATLHVAARRARRPDGRPIVAFRRPGTGARRPLGRARAGRQPRLHRGGTARRQAPPPQLRGPPAGQVVPPKSGGKPDPRL